MFNHITKEQQMQKALRIFTIAREKSKFYKEKYKTIGEITTNDDWLTIPPLMRNELFNNSFPKTSDMLTQEIEGMIITSTGGSSGLARYGILTYSEWDEFVNVQAEALKLMSITSKDIVANLFVAGNLWPSFIGLHDNIRKLGSVHLPISANIDIDRILHYLLEFKPTVLLSLPTVFIFLADKIIQKNLKIDFVKIIGYAGEHMSDTIKKHLKKAFGDDLEIRALAYTSADCGLMGYQCSECNSNEYHLPNDFQFIEIYNFEENRLCELGEKGEVLVTNLARPSLPIIRYRIGDVARWKKSECNCGDKNPLFFLDGRAGDDFKIGGAFISMDVVENSISDFVSTNGISANYQLQIDDVNENKMEVVLKIESSDLASSQKEMENIKKNMKKNINEFVVGEEMGYLTLNVEFIKLGELPRSPITGKVKHLDDKRVKS